MNSAELAVNQVVTLDGKSRRYAVTFISKVTGEANLRALSGAVAGSGPTVSPARLSLDADQTIAFSGAIAAKLQRAYGLSILMNY